MPSLFLDLAARHPAQEQIAAEARRFSVACCGRRFGKSRLGEDLCADPLLDGKPVGFFSPTYKMLSELFREMVETFAPVTESVNQSEHRLELITGGVLEMWSLDAPESIRGRHYRRIIVDECAVVRGLMPIWDLILRPTLIDLEGDAFFFSTPKGLGDFQTLYDYGQDDAYPEWASWRFPSSANPYLPVAEIESMRRTMPAHAYEQEILARFIDEVSGALWRLAMIDACRVREAPELARVVVAIDPAVTSSATSDETGIIAAGVTGGPEPHGYVLADRSGRYSPDAWARAAIDLYHGLGADHIVAEANQGGDLVRFTLRTVDASVPVKLIHASRGKVTRAEPVVAMYEQRRVHHVGILPDLETQMVTWSPVDDRDSPDRVDACLAGDVLVITRRGERPIRDVCAGDFVWTRAGWRSVVAARRTRKQAVIMVVEMSDGNRLRATHDHRVWTERGWATVDTLVYGDILSAWTIRQKSCSVELCSSVIQTLATGLTAFTTHRNEAVLARFTEPYGEHTTDRFRAACSSTISTAIRSTIRRRISLPFRRLSIARRTLPSMTWITWKESVQWRRHGTEAQRGLPGTSSTVLTDGRTASTPPDSAKSADEITCLALPPYRGSVLVRVLRAGYARITAISTSSRAPSVVRSSGGPCTSPVPRPAHVSVARVYVSSELADVYDLQVDGVHEFVAAGVIVHNCVYALTELMLKRPMKVARSRQG